MDTLNASARLKDSVTTVPALAEHLQSLAGCHSRVPSFAEVASWLLEISSAGEERRQLLWRNLFGDTPFEEDLSGSLSATTVNALLQLCKFSVIPNFAKTIVQFLAEESFEHGVVPRTVLRAFLHEVQEFYSRFLSGDNKNSAKEEIRSMREIVVRHLQLLEEIEQSVGRPQEARVHVIAALLRRPVGSLAHPVEVIVFPFELIVWRQQPDLRRAIQDYLQQDGAEIPELGRARRMFRMLEA
jgi:hypothetical protein